MAKTGLKKNTISFFIILAIVIVLGMIYYYLDKVPARESIVNYNPSCTANDPKSNRICSNGQYVTCPGGFFPSPLGSHVCVTKEKVTSTNTVKCDANYVRVPNTTTCRELVPSNKVPHGWTLSEGKASVRPN